MLHPVGEQSPASLRHAIELEIERLISLLDAMDGDADLEPSLAGFDRDTGDLESDTADDEPSLGWVTRWQSGRIVTGSDSDLEAVPVVGGDK